MRYRIEIRYGEPVVCTSVVYVDRASLCEAVGTVYWGVALTDAQSVKVEQVDESSMTKEQRQWVVGVLKGANLHLCLLNDFERSFVQEATSAYARYGEKTHTSAERLKVFVAIAAKLYLPEALDTEE
jgi:hypothetical protein